MDAARLVAEAERSMSRDQGPENVIAEAWQAYELTEALERRLGDGHGGPAAPGSPEERGGPAGPAGQSGKAGQGGRHAGSADSYDGAGARDPGGTALRAGPAPVMSATGVGPPRAARMSAVRDPTGTLRALRVLLGEIGHALVGLITTAADEDAYWQSIEALDAVDEAKDRVRALSRAHPG